MVADHDQVAVLLGGVGVGQESGPDRDMLGAGERNEEACEGDAVARPIVERLLRRVGDVRLVVELEQPVVEQVSLEALQLFRLDAGAGGAPGGAFHLGIPCEGVADGRRIDPMAPDFPLPGLLPDYLRPLSDPLDRATAGAYEQDYRAKSGEPGSPGHLSALH